MQRHHLLPRQLLQTDSLSNLFEALRGDSHLLDDFRFNGLLLPSTENAARRMQMPMHRGPHHHYNALVAERVGQIESGWQRQVLREPSAARTQAIMRIALLQRALRRRLLCRDTAPLLLNRKDPFSARAGFLHARCDG